MCQHEELVVNESGYVIRCRQCQHYQVFFGGIVLSLSKEEFFQMQQELSTVPEQPFSRISKSIMVATPKRGVHLWLSPAEIANLFQLLDEADTERQTKELFALFQ